MIIIFNNFLHSSHSYIQTYSKASICDHLENCKISIFEADPHTSTNALISPSKTEENVKVVLNSISCPPSHICPWFISP